MEHRDSAGIATFFTAERPAAGSPLVLGEETAHHARVRRLEVGDRIRLLDGAGAAAWGRIVRLSRSSLAVDVDTVEQIEPPPPIHVLVPVADRDRMLWLAEKCAELGAASWRPVLWRRSRSVSPRGEGSTFRMKIRARMVAALEQSGGAWLPALYPDAQPEHAVAAVPGGTRVLLDADGDPILGLPLVPPLSIAVGPEGGLESAERDLFLHGGFVRAAVGGTVLRFETAGVAALAVARAALASSGERVNG